MTTTWPSGRAIAAVATAAILLAVARSGGAAGAAELPFAPIVAGGAEATTAVLPDGSWSVELAPLQPGDGDVAVSPDGRRVAFVSERDGNPEVYVADARSRDVRRLTTNPRGADRRPSWSPDGRRIAWESGSDGRADIFVMRANGSEKRLVAGGATDDADPAWSPDGGRVAFSSTRSGRRQLWAVAAAGGEPQLLAPIPGAARAPAWSPGGKRIAFARESAGNSDIWVLDLTDSSARRLTRDTGWDSRPDWAPNADRIVFARASRGLSSLWTVGLDGAAARPVVGSDGLVDPDWARTDRALVPLPDERLPDLDQRSPAGLVVTQAGRRFRLGFASSTQNLGRGPLVIRGVRSGRAMTAHQVVELAGGGARTVRDVGTLHYELHPPHRHWHLESFVRYELRRAVDNALAVRDRKSGFCLVDRWGQVFPRFPGTGAPRFVGDCGAGQPDARRVLEGTSVGYIDRYPAFFHGQDLDITGLSAGRYLLVHRANPERAMRELRYSNDSASLLLDVAWPAGRAAPPRVTVLRRCEATEQCPSR